MRSWQDFTASWPDGSSMAISVVHAVQSRTAHCIRASCTRMRLQSNRTDKACSPKHEPGIRFCPRIASTILSAMSLEFTCHRSLCSNSKRITCHLRGPLAGRICAFLVHTSGMRLIKLPDLVQWVPHLSFNLDEPGQKVTTARSVPDACCTPHAALCAENGLATICDRQ